MDADGPGPGIGRRIAWGIAGFGWVARDFVAPAMAAAGHRLVAVADPDERARDRAARLGAAAHATPDALAADPAVEAIYVATPNDRHRAAVEAACRAGKPVLCEKPLAASLDDALAIADVVRTSGVAYRTAFDQRHHPAHEAVRRAIADGAIGTPVALRIVYACWLGPDWTPDGGAGGANWRTEPARAGGGALIDLAPHGIDLAASLLGDEVACLEAVLQRRVHPYPVDDGALVSGRTRAGTLLSLHVAYNHPDTLPRRRLEILGTGGLLTARDTMGQDPGGTVTLEDARPGRAPVELRFDRDASPFTRQLRAFAELLASGGRDADGLDRDLAGFRLLLDAAARARTTCP